MKLSLMTMLVIAASALAQDGDPTPAMMPDVEGRGRTGLARGRRGDDQDARVLLGLDTRSPPRVRAEEGSRSPAKYFYALMDGARARRADG